MLKSERIASKDRERQAKRRRDAKLKKTSSKCKRKARAVKEDCAAERFNIREQAREAERKERAKRREVTEDYRFAMGRAARAAPKGRRYSKAESDSLAAQNVDAELVDLFYELRQQFPYDLEPDARAELFGEWVEEHPDEVTAWRAERFEDIDYGAEYERFAAEREAVPF